SRLQVHAGRVPGGCRVQRRQAHRRLRELGARHLQPREGEGQSHARHDVDGQQADRRRLVRARRFRERQPRGHGRARARHLRRDAGPEGAGRQAEGRQADGDRLLDSGERRARHARRRALDQLRREPRVLPQPEQPDQLRADVTDQTSFDQVMDFTVVQKLGSDAKYASQKNEYDVHFAPASAGSTQGEKNEILTKTIVIHFFPNSWDLTKKVTRNVDGKEVEELYDPNVTFVVEEVGKLAGQFGAARIVIEGHADGSMKGQVPKNLVQELSLNRANAVKEALVRKFPSLQPNQ